MAQTNDGATDELADATSAREAAQAALDDADHEFRAAIRQALDMGTPVRLIADVANLSRERVYQIRDGRR